VIYADDFGNILKRVAFPTESCEKTLEKIFNAVQEMGECRAIGISCGSPLDEKKGIIMSPPNLVGWDDVHIVEMLEKRFGVPAYLCNDANACALAEWKFGAGKGTQNMIFLTFGTGMGAGLILDGKLYSGTNGNAGECGHVRMTEQGPVGYGKSGSFEGYCSGGGIKQIGQTVARELLQMGKRASFCESMQNLDEITAKSVAKAAHEGNADAIRVYDICAEKLGMGLSMLIDLFNPEIIVLGSIFERSEDLLRQKAEEIIKREALPMSASVCKIRPALLGDTIGDCAAVAVAMQSK